MRISLAEAEEKLGELIDRVQRGEQVIIEQEDRPVAEIVPIRKKKFKLGILQDQLKGPIPDFLEPMSEEDLRLWEGRS